MDIREKPLDPSPDGHQEGAFERLEELARRTARDLTQQNRPFDSYPGNTAGAKRLLGFLHLPAKRSSPVTHPAAWRLHSMRLTETSTFALTATGAAGACRNYVQTDDELWLRSDGEMFLLAFRTHWEDYERSLSVTTRPLSPLSAARYDYTPVWKTKHTEHSHASIEERWLEILGKPWYQDPYESISKLLSSLSAGAIVPSGVQLAIPGDVRGHEG